MSYTIPETQLAVVINKQLKEEIQTIPVGTPGDDELLVKTTAYSLGTSLIPKVESNIGAVYGSQSAGIVVKVGKNVTQFQPGDEVCFFNHGGYLPFPYPGSFSEYVVSRQHATYKFGFKLKTAAPEVFETEVPTTINTWEQAATLGMPLGTIGTSFYWSFGFRKGQDYSKDTLLIWSAGGAIAYVGIQLAQWLGFGRIVTTSNKSKIPALLELGVDGAFDYADPDVVEKIRAKYGDDINYGLDGFASAETFSKLYDATSRTKPVVLDNLLRKTEKDLVDVTPKTNPVQFKTTSSYLSYGDDLNMFGFHVPVPPGMVEALEEFQKDVRSFIASEKAMMWPIRFLPNGLYGLCGETAEKNYSQYKFVSRASDTKPPA